jgi:hypothetical protein
MLTTSITSTIAAALIAQHGAIGLSPIDAIRAITGDPAAGNSRHIDRTIAHLRAAGVHPVKIAGRWTVPLAQIVAWTGGQDAQAPAPAPAPRRGPGRPRKAAGGAP